MKLQEILERAVRDEDVSDVFFVAGLPVTMKRSGRQVRVGEQMLMPKDIDGLVEQIYTEGRRTRIRLENGEDDDFSLSISRRKDENGEFPGGRFRVNVFRQRGSLAGSPGEKTIFITEGPLKGDLAHALSGRTFGCVPGANQYANLPPFLQAMKLMGAEAVYEAYDMDKLLRTACRGGLQ